MPDSAHDVDAFEAEAQRRRRNIVLEFLSFLAHNKKWWLLPILLILLLLALLVALGGTAVAPFLYPIF